MPNLNRSPNPRLIDSPEMLPRDPREVIASHYGSDGVACYDHVAVTVNAFRHDGHPELSLQVSKDGTQMRLRNGGRLTEEELRTIHDASVPLYNGCEVTIKRTGPDALMTFKPVS